MINDLLSRIFENQHDFIYRLVSYQDLKLCLDIGAAAGFTTRKIKEMGDQETKIIAFEPFPGNHKYFLENTKNLTNIELITKAVGNTIDPQSKFYVDSVVSGQELGWENLSGYSSLGFLTQDSQDINNKKQGGYISDFLKENLRSLKKYLKRYILKKEKTPPSQAQILNVEQITLDSIIENHVDFCKIDVQGGEFDVLKGAENLINIHGIDVIYLEYSGDLRIIEFLTDHEYAIFDTDYLFALKKSIKLADVDIGGIHFRNIRNINLSTGQQAYLANLRFSKSDISTALQSINNSNQFSFIQTDLICVNKFFLKEFIQNVGRLIKENTNPL